MTLQFRISFLLLSLIAGAWWWLGSDESVVAPGDVIRAIRVKGVTLEAPPRPTPDSPLMKITEVNANWIAIIPFGFTRQESAQVQFNSDRQWWGERTAGVRETIIHAHNRQLKVMLKPQLWIRGSWTGDLSFEQEGQWETWEQSYTDFILTFAHLADSLQVDLFCLGTEFRNAIAARPAFWFNLIHQVRQIYHGSLTYAANWDDFDQVPFWDSLDYVGINAYFPLLRDENPTVEALIKAWKPYRKKIHNWSARMKKPVLFTEYGYLSVDGCAFNTWELEDRLPDCRTNELAQANAYEALFTVWSQEPYWQGGFLWKWYPQINRHHRHLDKDYTPQGKIAQNVITRWFQP